MYLLNSTPVFLEFLKKFFKFTNMELTNNFIEENLCIQTKCFCEDKGCATIYLQSRKAFKKYLQGIYSFDTNKGYFVIHIEDDGSLKFEALEYDNFPYKKEIDNLLKNQKAIHDSFPAKTKNKQILTKRDKQKLHRYFWNLKQQEINVVDVGEIE